MAKKPTPIITHTEILCRAIRNIEDEIRNQQNHMGGIPECESILHAFVEEHTTKLEALKEMYRIETGTNSTDPLPAPEVTRAERNSHGQ